MPRETFPKVPGIGGRNAHGSKYTCGIPSLVPAGTPAQPADRPEVTLLPGLKPGAQFRRSGMKVSPVPSTFDPTCGVNGNPLCAVKIPFHCQPPMILSVTPPAFDPNCRPCPNGSS